jgi:hypothetical protein
MNGSRFFDLSGRAGPGVRRVRRAREVPGRIPSNMILVLVTREECDFDCNCSNSDGLG